LYVFHAILALFRLLLEFRNQSLQLVGTRKVVCGFFEEVFQFRHLLLDDVPGRMKIRLLFRDYHLFLSTPLQEAFRSHFRCSDLRTARTGQTLDDHLMQRIRRGVILFTQTQVLGDNDRYARRWGRLRAHTSRASAKACVSGSNSVSRPPARAPQKTSHIAASPGASILWSGQQRTLWVVLFIEFELDFLDGPF
jgi:hypothetical protein